MQVVIDGSGNITDWTAGGDTLEDGIEFPYVPRGGSGFPYGFTVTGDAPNRKLKQGTSTVAIESVTPHPPLESGGGGGGGGVAIPSGDDPPADPADGDFWFDPNEELGPSALPDGLSILNEGVAVADVESLDFVGPLVAATAMGPDGTVTISGLTVADAGSTQGVAGAVTTIDFTGAGVAATVTGATATVNIDGGGGGGGGGSSPARVFGGTPNSNSTSETDLQVLAIPATVGANDIIRGIFDCTWANTSGAAVTFQPKVYIGTTAITSFTAFSVANGNTHRVRIQVEIAVQNPTNDLHTNVGLHAQGTSPNGIASSNPLSGRSNHVNVTTEDLSAGKNLRLTSTLGTAHADASNTPVTAWLEIVEAS